MTSKEKERQKGVIALILLALFASSMGLFIRYLNTSFSILQQVYLRILIAFLISLAVFYKDLDFSKLKKISFKEWLLLTFRATAFYLLGVNLFSQAMILTKYSNVSFIRSLPMTAVLGLVLLGEKFTRKKILFVLSAFIGVILIGVKDFSNILIFGKGETVAFLSILFMPLSNVLRKWHTNLLNNKEITQLMFAIAFVMVLATSLFLNEELPTTKWNIILILALFGAGLFNVFIIFFTNYGYQRVKAVLANNIITAESLFALGIGYIFYKELPTFKELFGSAIILYSAIQMNRLESKEK